MENKTVKAPTPLGEKGRAVVAYLQANEGAHFGHDIANALELNPKGIHGVMNGLFKRDLVVKGSAEGQAIDKDGNEVTRTYTTYALSDAGIAFDVEDLTK